MKILVYCRTFKDCTEVYRHFFSYFGGNTTDLSMRTFDMVHSRTPNNVKEYVQDAIQVDDSNLRILIATKNNWDGVGLVSGHDYPLWIANNT